MCNYNINYNIIYVRTSGLAPSTVTTVAVSPQLSIADSPDPASSREAMDQ